MRSMPSIDVSSDRKRGVGIATTPQSRWCSLGKGHDDGESASRAEMINPKEATVLLVCTCVCRSTMEDLGNETTCS